MEQAGGPAGTLDTEGDGGIANDTDGDGDGGIANDTDQCEVPDADPDLPEVPEPDTETDQCGRPAGRVRRLGRTVLPVLIGVAAVSVVAGAAGDSHAMVAALRSVRLRLVVVALVCEAASFGALSVHLRLLGGPAANVRRLAPFRIALVVFGLGSVMPAAPAEGLVMAGAALKRRRLARRRTALVLGVSQAFGIGGLYALAGFSAIAVVALAHDGPLRAPGLILALGAGILVLLALTALALTRTAVAEWAALAAGRLRHPRHPSPPAERRRRGAAWHEAAMHVVRDHHRAPQLVASVVAAWALDGSCLYFALAAVGVHVHLDVLLLAYSVGAAAAMIPLLPAGLGVVETVTPALLHLYGVPIEAALAGLLVYRALGTFSPAVAGAGALAALRLESPAGEESVPVPA